VFYGASTLMEAAISELYRVFKPYRLGDDFTGCDHCVSQTDSARLAATPLRELTVCDVDRYAFKAMTTWGMARHFKYFLPRLFELAFDRYLEFNDPEVLMGKLAYAKWMSWSAPEREVVHRYLDNFWLHQLQLSGDFPTDERIRIVLGGLAEACGSLIPYLAIWSSQQAALAALHLAQLISDSADEIMTTGNLRLWSKPSKPSRELVEWLSSDEALRLLNTNRDSFHSTFPLVFNHLDGIRASTSEMFNRRSPR
jgi:hypothetical protein